MVDSRTLLKEYVRSGSEAAFGELVARYLGLVYSTALRLVAGDAHRAQDVAQTVFIRLARRASGLSHTAALGGWLHRDTCNVAATVMRGERRRQTREIQAAEMDMLNNQLSENLKRITPILDDAINGLGAADRTAILLRFFEQRDFRSIGETLGTTDDAAQKRVTRAVEKLRSLLRVRGVSVSLAVLGTVLGSEAVAAVPPGLAATIAGTAAANAAAAGGTVVALFKVFSMTNAKIGIVGALVVVGMGTALVEQHQKNSELKRQITGLQAQSAERKGQGQKPTDLGVVQRFDWPQVESTDYQTYIGNLRAVGCPEQTIRDIITADLNNFFDEREKKPLNHPIEFWKTGTDPKQWVKEQLIKRHADLEGERTRILKNLLGSDALVESRPAKVTDADVKFNLLDFIAPEERTKALEVINELDGSFETKFKPLLDGDRWDKSARDEFGKFYQEREQKLLAALGPEAKEDYEVRETSLTSQVGPVLRFRFRGLEFSEAEFRELYRFAKPFELQLTGVYLDMNDAAQRELNGAAQRAIWNKARAIIGDERFYGGVPAASLMRFGINPYARPSATDSGK